MPYDHDGDINKCFICGKPSVNIKPIDLYGGCEKHNEEAKEKSRKKVIEINRAGGFVKYLERSNKK